MAQFALFRWGADVKPPFSWVSVTQEDARSFLMDFAQNGAKAATTRRKLASLRAFYRWMAREGQVSDNPFSALRGPRLAKSLPKVLSVEEAKRFLQAPLDELERLKKSSSKSNKNNTILHLSDVYKSLNMMKMILHVIS